MKRIQTLSLPINGGPTDHDLHGEIVHAERWANDIVLYVEHDDDTEGRPVSLLVVATGVDVPEHAGHVVTSGGGEGFIWHVFDVREPDEEEPVTSTGCLFARPDGDEQEGAVRAILGDAYDALQAHGVEASLYLSLHTSPADVEEP